MAQQRTEREQDIEQIAGIIARHIDGQGWDDEDFGIATAQEINQETGWGFDVRYDTHVYVDDTSYTRVGDVVLTDDELRRAYAMAQTFAR